MADPRMSPRPGAGLRGRAPGGLPGVLTGAPLSREDVTAIARRVRVDDPDSQWNAFLAVMIWGYGRVGCSLSRVKAMREAEGFTEALAQLTRVTLEKGGAAGYQLVRGARCGSPAGSAFLKHLGPASGTKYIYFLARAWPVEGQGVAPVLDSVVRMWFKQHAPTVDVQIGDGWGHADRYATYVATLQDWGSQLGIPADDVERLIFVSRQVDMGGTWAEAWVGAPRGDADELLEALATRFAELDLADVARPHLGALAAQLSAAHAEQPVE